MHERKTFLTKEKTIVPYVFQARRKHLEDAIKLFRFFRECESFETWMNDKVNACEVYDERVFLMRTNGKTQFRNLFCLEILEQKGRTSITRYGTQNDCSTFLFVRNKCC